MKKGAKVFSIGRMSKVKQDEKHNNTLFGHWLENNIEMMFAQMSCKQQNAKQIF